MKLSGRDWHKVSVPDRLYIMLRRAFVWILLAVTFGAPAEARAQDPWAGARPPRDLVVLLHGMGRTSRSMLPLQRALEAEGYDVLNIGYSSTCCGIAELGAQVRQQLDSLRRPEHQRVHFVGHSLGNILVRWMLAQERPPQGVGRVVMLAPPNQGARSADRYSPVVDWLLEPIDELRTVPDATVRRLPPALGVPVGVIAARYDGKVAVEETHLAGEAAHLVVDSNHAFIMRDAAVLRETLRFLQTGGFSQ